jgi:hypothetical protein
MPHLHAVAAVDLHLARIVNPGHLQKGQPTACAAQARGLVRLCVAVLINLAL